MTLQKIDFKKLGIFDDCYRGSLAWGKEGLLIFLKIAQESPCELHGNR
jgi:hypothetical protein